VKKKHGFVSITALTLLYNGLEIPLISSHFGFNKPDLLGMFLNGLEQWFGWPSEDLLKLFCAFLLIFPLVLVLQ